MFKRNRVAMLVAEFLGTGVLTLAILSIQRSQLGLALFVALAAGATVVLLTQVFGHTSGAQLNPALTIALWTARRVKTIPALTYIVAQLLGAWAAYGLYHYFVNAPIQEVTQEFNARIMVAEAIGTMVFALAWAAAAYNRYDNSRFSAVSGLAYAAGIIIASAASVGLINPAVALGANAWELFGNGGWLFFGDNGWRNYLVGPLLGAVIGVNLYGLLFANNKSERALATADTKSAAAAVIEPKEVEDTDIDVDKAINENAKSKKVAPKAAVTKKKAVATTKKATAKKTNRKR